MNLPASSLLLAAGLLAPAVAQARPINVVVILADQWRAQALGYAGDPNVKTPHLDALERQSVRFVQAVSNMPVCSPMRASLLTGQRPLTHGVFMNDAPLAPDACTIGKVLLQAGYTTGYIGKWHIDGHGRSEYIPPERRQGFEYWKVLECTHDYNHSFYFADGPDKLQWEGYDAIAQSREAQRYIRARAQGKKPFALVLAWGPPHDPYMTAPQQYRDLYDPARMVVPANVPAFMQAPARQRMAGYYAHCTALDQCVGDVWQTCKDAGIEDDTLLVFTSDHGDLLGAHGAFFKQQPYEESVRVPLLLHCPSRFGRTARRLDSIINTEDLMPTILSLCDAVVPPTAQGVNFGPFLRAPEVVKDPSAAGALILCPAPFGQWSRSLGGREYRAVRTARYTYARDLHGPWLLFDNQRDPGQMENLVGHPEQAALQAQMETLLQDKLRQTGDEFLPARDYIKKWGYQVDQTGTIPYKN